MIHTVLEGKNISYTYQNVQILNDLSLHVRQGEFVTIVGKSGSGKTTLFQLLTGILSLQEGFITKSNDIAYMLQEDLLLPWRTVLENTTLFAELGRSSTYRPLQLMEEAKHLLSELGLSNYLHYYSHQLSGGMRQRAALVRTLLQKKSILLLDEPFNSLDVNLKEQLYEHLKKRQQQEGTSILMVTHDFRDAIGFSDRILFLNEGCIQSEWTLNDQIRSDLSKVHSLQQEIKQSFAS